jgi:hypothetical protein
MYGAGIRGVLYPCARCSWFGTAGYEHARTDDIEMTRNPGLQAFLPAGLVAAGDRVEYRAESDSIRLTFGRAFRRVAPWAGVRGVRFRGELDIDLLIRTTGLPAEQSQAAVNRYEEDLVEAIAGFDVRIPRNLVLRAEGSTDGDSYRLAAGIGFALGR